MAAAHPKDQQDRIILLIRTERGLWRLACQHDGISPDVKGAAFSLDNPFTPDLFAVMGEVRREVERYRAGA